VGIVLHVAILSSLIIHSSLAPKQSYRKLYLALALAPLIRIVSLSMPLLMFEQIYWYLLTGIPVLAATLVVIRILDLRPPDIGLTSRKMAFQVMVALTGIGFGLAEYYILKPEPLISSMSLGEMIVPCIILLVATGFVEELVFRGVMQHCSVEALGSWGWVYVAVVYSILQIGYESAQQWLLVLAVGLFFGWVVTKTGSILGAALAHGIINVGLYLVIPLVLPG
jgi:membrane protease YdiL (CAAX protease family)